MQNKFYVLNVLGGNNFPTSGTHVPHLVGPYKTRKTRDIVAKKLHNADNSIVSGGADNIFFLNVSNNGDVKVGVYRGGFLNGAPENII